MRRDYRWYFDEIDTEKLKRLDTQKGLETLNRKRRLHNESDLPEGHCLNGPEIEVIIDQSLSKEQKEAFGAVGSLYDFFKDEGLLFLALKSFANKTNRSDFYVFVVGLDFDRKIVSTALKEVGLAHWITIAVGLLPYYSEAQPRITLEGLTTLDREHKARQRLFAYSAAVALAVGALKYRNVRNNKRKKGLRSPPPSNYND